MRLLGKLILILLLLWGAVIAYKLYNAYGLNNSEDVIEQEKEFYSAHTAYFVGNDQEIRYNLPKNATNFKALVYPVIDQDVFDAHKDQSGLGKQITYALKVDYAGKKNQVEYSAEVKTYTQQITQESLQPFWLNDEQTVLLSRTLEFEVPKEKELNFSLASDVVSGYLIRTYYQQRQSRTRIKQRWQRMSNRRKENLLKYYPFDPDVISRNEINSLYKNAWSSVAPSSEKETKLETVNLFEYDERELLQANSGTQFSKLDNYLPKNAKYTFQARKPAEIRFDVQTLAEGDEVVAQLLHKQDNGSIKTAAYSLQQLQSLNLTPGNYELSFNQSVAFKVETDAEIDHLELPSYYTSLYDLDKNSSITYAVKSLPNIKAFYKASFHALDNVKQATVRIELFAGEERLSSSEETLKFSASDYMPFVTDKELGLRSISDAIEKNIRVNTRADRLVITALDAPVSLKLSNTVSGLAAIKKISDSSASSYQNAWFVLKPEQALTFLRDSKVSRYLNIGSNAIREERVAQSFEKLRPTNSQRYKVAYYLDAASIYSGNNGVSFRKLRTTASNQIKFNDKNFTSKRSIKPTLIVHSRDPNTTQLRFDNKDIVLENTELVQEHVLPRIPLGKAYRLDINAEKSQDIYLNYTSVGKQQLVKRQFFKANKTLKYKFYKKPNTFESLSLHLLSSKAKQVEIKTQLLKGGRLIEPQQTSAARKFIFDKPDATLTNNLLPSSDCSANCSLFTAQFLPLYEDLSAGWYELHIETPAREGFFIAVSKTNYQEDARSSTFSDEI